MIHILNSGKAVKLASSFFFKSFYLYWLSFMFSGKYLQATLVVRFLSFSSTFLFLKLFAPAVHHVDVVPSSIFVRVVWPCDESEVLKAAFQLPVSLFRGPVFVAVTLDPVTNSPSQDRSPLGGFLVIVALWLCHLLAPEL
jgi:hypothetical protein